MPKSPEKHHRNPLEQPGETMPDPAPGPDHVKAKDKVQAKDKGQDNKAKDKGQGQGQAKGGSGGGAGATSAVTDAVKDSGREHEPDAAAGRTAPETVNGNTRVNVAFPFSKIEVQEPSAELVELATLLVDLLGALADWVPEETLRDIRSRAEALCARLAV